MNPKFVGIVTIVAGLLVYLHAGSHANAAARVCNGHDIRCDTGKTGHETLRLAQAPSLSSSRASVAITQPKDDVPRKAFKALNRHCARCHQEGRLKRDKPAKGFGNILKLEEISRDPHLILPGNPDGSRLFSRIVKQEMPYDVYTEFSGGEEPSKKDVQAIYDWIESLDPKKVGTCSNRKPVDTTTIVAAISANLNKQAASKRKGMRYLTLANLYNACANDAEMRRFRNGAKILLNSLSRASKPTRISTIGKGGTIIAFNLDDLGWSEEDWDTLAAAYPYGTRPKSATFDQIKQKTKSSLPYLRADWFAAAASNPPLYYKLLDLPEDLEDLQDELGVAVSENVATGDVMRAGVGKSTISRHNRIVERHAVDDGYFWMTYDFDGTGKEQNIKKRPLGPNRKGGFEHDSNAVLFSLPNGMNAFYLADDEGKRIDTAPVDVLFDESTPRRPVIAGLSCISCHAQGVRKVVDIVRERAESGSKYSEEERDEILQMYVAEDELDSQIREDRKRTLDAAAKAGITLGKGNDGLDDVNYLAAKYNRDVDLRIAAAEYGVSKKRYASGLLKGNAEAKRTKKQLEQGTMTRRDLEPLFLKHVAFVSGDVPAGRVKAPEKIPAKPPLATAEKPKKQKQAKKPKKQKVAKIPPKPKKPKRPAEKPKAAAKKPSTNKPEEDAGTITLYADKTQYRANDLPVFTVKASSDCLLTLINVGPSGRAFVIFPNKYQQKNKIKGGKEFLFPGPDAPFQFRLKDIGKEKLIAECAIKQDGARIKHNFEEEEFTDLGDYRDHVGEQAEKEGEKKSSGPSSSKLLRTAITFRVK